MQQYMFLIIAESQTYAHLWLFWFIALSGASLWPLRANYQGHLVLLGTLEAVPLNISYHRLKFYKNVCLVSLNTMIVSPQKFAHALTVSACAKFYGDQTYNT